MYTVTFGVFLPLTLLAMAAAFNDSLRARVLAFEPVRRLEKRLVIGEKTYWMLFALIMAAGVFTRCWRFLELPMGYNQDGLMATVESYCLLKGGVDQLGTSWPTYFEAWGFAQMSVLYSWVMIPFVHVLGTCKLAMRLPMLLISLAMLPVVWDFSRRMLGKGFALLALFVAAVNPCLILHARWAVESNMLPHMALLGCYLLYIGRKNRLALYGSMVIFGFTPYAYGLACFSIPVILLCMAVYYVVRKKVSLLDVLVCVVIYFSISWPFFYTMAINALGLETAHLGPITMPLFELSQRGNDMPFSHLNPYAKLLSNMVGHVYATLLGGYDGVLSVIDWTHVLYRFMPPLVVYALYKLWRNRRELVLQNEDGSVHDGLMLMQIWLFASLVNGLIVGFVIIRNNISLYPLVFLCTYGLYLMGKRLRSAAALMLAMLVVSFAGLNVTYFTDMEYHEEFTNTVFHDGLIDALEDTRDWDYDEVYIGTGPRITDRKVAEASVMFAHDIDYAGRSEQTELYNSKGEPTGWYFTERYQFVNMDEFEPDPEVCSVYIFNRAYKPLFDEADYLITDYGNYAAAYPRYWAE